MTLAYIPSPTISQFSIGPVTIHFYALCILLGIVLAAGLLGEPVLASMLLKEQAHHEPWVMRQALRLYRPVLSGALARPRAAAAVALGALLVVLPAFLLFGKADFLPDAPLQWGVLVFLGLVSTALGMYWWNKGACLVNGGTLAVMNNLHVPVGLLLNLLIWNRDADLKKIALGGGVILLSLALNRAGRRASITRYSPG